MSDARRFTLSAFGDEVARDLEDQLRVLRALRIRGLELRTVWGKNVLDLGEDEARTVRRLCDEHGIEVTCIGSPIGKSPLAAPTEREAANLQRIFRVAEIVGTRRVRVFSFYPPDTSSNAHYDDYVAEASARLGRLTGLAGEAGFQLLMENEKEIVGDTPARCHAILSTVESPALRFAWDPANFIQVGVERPTERWWSLLAPYVAHIHVKDAVLADGSVRAAGEGDGQIPALLKVLCERGYRGVLALEPHLAFAGHSSGFSGEDGMAYAAKRLRQVMAEVGCAER